ncbi:MAG: hypothetical protein JWP20_23 [Roseomonas sp.]|nr:hypothetical protein [Roseomonas sp.]
MRPGGVSPRLTLGSLAMRAAMVLPLAGGAFAMRGAGRPGLAALLGVAALALAIGRRLGNGARLALACGIAALGLACWAWPGAMALLARLLPVLGDLMLAVHFGATLRRGREPLITRYTRYDPGTLLAECAGYTRRLTLLWTCLFLALAPVHTALLLGLPPVGTPVDSLTILGITGGLMLVLFLGEHVIRTLRFPQFGPATPARTLRAILSATLARHV